jgi:two-component system cell cycle sensor histidine kinase/response regulator CckA
MATVLIVDDRAVNREIARASLDYGGYQVIEATDGRQALNLARTRRPDVILTDVLMPGMDGYEFVRDLRSDPDTAGIPVLFYTANYREDEARPLATAFGVSKILSKDASPQQLLDAVAEALHDRPASVAYERNDFGAQHVSTVNTKLLEKIQALDESEARFAAMAEASPIGIVIADLDGNASYANPQLTEITQAPAAELLGAGWQRFLSEAQREALGHRHLAPGVLLPVLDGQRERVDLMLPGGRRRWLTVLVRPTRDGEGAVTGLIATVDDVSAEVEAEERRLAEERERESEARRQVTARFDSLTRLAGGVAHDFNNLLNIVMSFGEFVQDSVSGASGAVLTDQQAEDMLGDLDQIYRAAQRAAHLTHQLLTFGGRDVVKPVVVDINDIVGEVCGMIAGAIGHHVTITTELDLGLLHVLADASQISQVLLNLAVNACDAMPSGGSLHIETGNARAGTAGTAGTAGAAASLPDGEYVHLTVTDTGHGMDESTAARAMEPFFTTKAQGQGTGLGLATAYGVIKQAGGGLAIDAALGRGSIIHIYLPGTRQPLPVPERATPAPVAAGQTILLAEDEDGLRNLVTRLLTGAGYRVLAAANGQEALTLAEGHEGVIDVLLSDVAMPVCNGPQLAADLQRARPGTPVLFMSGYAALIMTDQGQLDPDVIVVRKPFSRDQLLGALAATLSGTAASATAAARN